MKTLLLSNEDVGKVVDLDEIYEAVKNGYISLYNGNVVQPEILHIYEPNTKKGFDYKCCLDLEAGYYSMKSSSGGVHVHSVPVSGSSFITRLPCL